MTDSLRKCKKAADIDTQRKQDEFAENMPLISDWEKYFKQHEEVLEKNLSSLESATDEELADLPVSCRKFT